MGHVKKIINKFLEEIELEKQSPVFKQRKLQDRIRNLELVMGAFGDMVDEKEKERLREIWRGWKKELNDQTNV